MRPLVVLEEMAKLFKTWIFTTGPCEGCIKLFNIHTSTWISDKSKRKELYRGRSTELRFSLNSPDEEKKFIHETLSLCCFFATTPRSRLFGVATTTQTPLKRISWADWGPRYRYDDKQVADMLGDQCLCVSERITRITHGLVGRSVRLRLRRATDSTQVLYGCFGS